MEEKEKMVPAESRLKGKVEGLVGRKLKGWLWDEGTPDAWIEFDVLVDGVSVATDVADGYREDLARANIGDGKHSFATLLPGSLFDGGTHNIVVRELKSGRKLKALEAVVLDAALQPKFTGGIDKIQEGVIKGYIYDANNPRTHINVALCVDGAHLAVVVADKPSPGKHALTCGFEINLADIEITTIASKSIDLVTIPDSYIMATQLDLISNLFFSSIQMVQDLLLVSVHLSIVPCAGISFDVLVDDVLQMQLICSPLNPSSRLVGHIPVAELGEKTHLLSVRLSGTDREVSGSPHIFGRPLNFIKNPSFEMWTGSVPDEWSMTLPNRSTAAPVYANDSVITKSKAPDTGIKISSSAQANIDGVSISQQFQSHGLQTIDVVIKACAEERTTLGVLLAEVRPPDEIDNCKGALYLEKQPLIVWRSWTTKRLTFRLPEVLQGRLLQLSIEIVDSPASNLTISTVSAGAQGFEYECEADEKDQSQTDAVINGAMTYWDGPLRKLARLPITNLAEGWALACKKPDLKVEARLTEILTRDPKHADPGSLVHAIAIIGRITNRYIRLEAQLDTLQLASAPPERLSFYAKSGTDPNSDTELTNRTTVIGEILVVERRRLVGTNGLDEETRVSDERVSLIARRVVVRKTGENFTFDLGIDNAKQLKQRALENFNRQEISYILAFQFSDFVDIAIANVSFGKSEQKIVESRPVGYVSIEDFNIKEQIGQLKGVIQWSELKPLMPPSWTEKKMATSADIDIRWTWPETPIKSVDIVICVHNALDETLECLASIRRYTDVPYTLTIIDDASEPHVGDRLRLAIRDLPWMRILSTGTNVGYTRAANIGLSSTNAEWIVLLNSDTIVTPNWLQGMFEVVDKHNDVAMVGPLSNAASWQTVPDLHDIKNKWKVNAIPEHMSINQVASYVSDLSSRNFPFVRLLNGFCTLMKRSVIEEVGFLDERAFPEGYGEENDLCIRVGQAGFRLAIADHVYVYHVKSASFGRERRDLLSKRGTASFKAKHPDIDLAEITRSLAEETTLTEMRVKLRKRLTGLQSETNS